MGSVSSLDKTLRQFEATDANLVKLERLWKEIYHLIPSNIAFGHDEKYEDNCRSYERIVNALPSIEGFKPETIPMNLNEIAQARLDAKEIGEIEAEIFVERSIDRPGVELREYRFRLHHLRRTLVRQAISRHFKNIEVLLEKLIEDHQSEDERISLTEDLNWIRLQEAVSELNTLLGDAVTRPSRWGDLYRHLRFGKRWDLDDIVKVDWPIVKEALLRALSEHDDPVPTEVADLSELVAQEPTGPIATKLLWGDITDDDFERLIFMLISSENGYENPEWLMNTRAADKGRDLSVTRVMKDGLSGVTRKRVIIQCKHYLKTSITVADVATLKEQIKLWEPPRIDTLVIATSGRFTSDAVAAIEQHNQSDSALRIEMWPESHLENLLASRPAIVGELRLR